MSDEPFNVSLFESSLTPAQQAGFHRIIETMQRERQAAIILCEQLTEERDTARRELDDAQGLLRERAAEIERLKTEHDASSLLRHNADMRGIAMWREESPEDRDLTWPSHDDLVCYLLKRLDADETCRDPKHEHATLDNDMIAIIRQITDAAGHGGVPFLDDAVRNVVIERDRARTNLSHADAGVFRQMEAVRTVASVLGITRDDGPVPLHERIVPEAERLRADLDQIATYLEVPPDETTYSPRGHRILTAVQTLNEARLSLHADFDKLRDEFNARIRAEEQQTAAARAQFRNLQESAGQLARAAAAAHAEIQAMSADAVELVPVEVHADELTTSLGRFPMVRHDLAGLIVVALRILPGDEMLAQHFANAIRARFDQKALVIVSREAPARTVRLFRVVPVAAPQAPQEDAAPEMREQDAATLGQPVPPPALAVYEEALATQYIEEEVAEIMAAAHERAARLGVEVRPILRDACRMAVASPPAGVILAAIRATEPAAALETAATP